jgi:hypothetical protein
MMDFSGLLHVIGTAFIDWLKIFAAPMKNLDMLWILVPIYGSWIFAEFFQEKKETSFGNAISNGAVMLFVGIDWIRQAITLAKVDGKFLFGEVIIQMAIAAFILAFGIWIIVMGIKAKKLVKYIGRVREVSYLMIMFTPIVYGVIKFNIENIILIFAFLPLFYVLVEILDHILPDPISTKTEEVEAQLKSGLGPDLSLSNFNMPPGNIGSDFGQDVFGQPRQQQFSPPPLSPSFAPPQPPQQQFMGQMPMQRWPQQQKNRRQ